MNSTPSNQSPQKQQAASPRHSPRSVHTITDRFSMDNTYLIEDERLIVVDPGSERNVRMLQDYLLHFLHRPVSDIDLIVLTHLHSDHTAGVAYLQTFCSAPVAASAIVRQLAERGKYADTALLPGMAHITEHLFGGTMHHLDLFRPDYAQRVKMVGLWLEDVMGLPGHPDWRVIASPGHTPDSLCLYNPFSRELLCGDTVITIEGGAPLLHGGTNRRQLHETLQTLRHLPIHYLYPGHGRAIIAQSPLTTVKVEW
ncbi:MBL fold metallo-hydrolase [Tengunoibacter tsumagoiensis]|uniref:MBL fold metallo-hydrolase n=1 Tax=Tengunoibacter tsumagoiensis TaxID=2014871 RepID=A0A401ZWM4_9CHLR|nr:MBL fold metallo-hydrolase [Tengunoibacter tsumagoiensis]GCE11212.1 MBL fold metallo-hydrolase [Tengunoibacter tsumagoiensis]